MINDGGFDLEALVYTLYNTLLIRHSLAIEIVRFETDNHHTTPSALELFSTQQNFLHLGIIGIFLVELFMSFKQFSTIL